MPQAAATTCSIGDQPADDAVGDVVGRLVLAEPGEQPSEAPFEPTERDDDVGRSERREVHPAVLADRHAAGHTALDPRGPPIDQPGADVRPARPRLPSSTAPRPVHPGAGLAQVTAAAVLFGVNASVSKVVLEAGVPPRQLAALRCTGVAVGLLLLVGPTARRRLAVPWVGLRQLAVLGVVGAALIQWLYFVAIDRLPVGIAILLEFTGPVMVAVFARVVLREEVRGVVWVALVLSLAGLGARGRRCGRTPAWTPSGSRPPAGRRGVPGHVPAARAATAAGATTRWR